MNQIPLQSTLAFASSHYCSLLTQLLPGLHWLGPYSLAIWRHHYHHYPHHNRRHHQQQNNQNYHHEQYATRCDSHHVGALQYVYCVEVYIRIYTNDQLILASLPITYHAPVVLSSPPSPPHLDLPEKQRYANQVTQNPYLPVKHSFGSLNLCHGCASMRVWACVMV